MDASSKEALIRELATLRQRITELETVEDRHGRLEAALQRRAAELKSLNVLGNLVGTSLSLEQVVLAGLEGVSNCIDPDLTMLYLREGDQLILQGSQPDAPEFRRAGGDSKRVGDCLCGLVASAGIPIYASDIHTDPRCTLNECKTVGMHSFAALPLLEGSNVLGVLGVASLSEQDFEERAAFLEALAGEIAVGVQNALLHQRVQRHVAELEQQVRRRQRIEDRLRQKIDELSALYAASQVFLTQIDVETTLQNICRLVVDGFRLKMAWVGLTDDEGFDVRPASAYGFDEGCLDGIRVTWDDSPTGRGPTGTAIRTARPISANQIEVDPAYAPWRSEALARGYRSTAALPLCHGERVLGALNLYSVEPAYFTPDRLQVLQSFANLAAVALENARLYAETNRRAEHLATIHELDQAITVSLRLEEVYQAFAQHTSRLLPYDWMSIALREGEVLTVTFVENSGESAPLAGARLTHETSAIAWVMEHGQPMCRSDIGSAPRFFEDEQLGADGIQSYIILPLRVKGQVIGAWNLGQKGGRGYTLDDLAVAQSMSDQLAIAVENARLFEQLHASREGLHILSRRLLAVQEAERRHIARELHDEIGQVLTGLGLVLEMGKKASGESSALAPAPVPQWDQALGMVNDLSTSVQELSLNLRPAMLDDLGLLPTLVWHFNRYTDQTGVGVDFKYVGPEKRLAAEIETAAYRIVQEGLTNVARYAGVKDVTVRLWLEPDLLRVQIEDAGVGFDPETAWEAHATGGLSGMQERATLLGGRLVIESALGAGTCLVADLPLPEKGEAA